MAVKFNNAFFDELSTSPAVTALCVEAAERVAAIARSTAPVESGDYKKSIVVSTKRQRRAVALVVSDDPKVMIIEAKTGNLARALRKASRAR